MKRILTLLAALALVAFIVAPALAFQFDEGEFIIGLVGTSDEMGVDMGSAVAESGPVTLFDAGDIGGSFSGDTTFSQIRIGGAAYSEVKPGRDPYDRQMWFAVEAGQTPVADLSGFTGIQTPLTNIEALSDGTTTNIYNIGASSNRMAGLLDGYYGTAIEDPIGYVTLAGLTATNPIKMDIWMYDNMGTDDLGDDETVNTTYQLVIGIDANNQVYAQVTAVPVPGALVLLGSGLLALVGVRRKNA